VGFCACVPSWLATCRRTASNASSLNSGFTMASLMSSSRLSSSLERQPCRHLRGVPVQTHAEGRAERVEFGGEVLRAARGRALAQQLRGEEASPAWPLALRAQAGRSLELHLDDGQSRTHEHGDAHPIGQRLDDGRCHARRGRGEGQQRQCGRDAQQEAVHRAPPFADGTSQTVARPASS
jgi:hypothetical protein